MLIKYIFSHFEHKSNIIFKFKHFQFIDLKFIGFLKMYILSTVFIFVSKKVHNMSPVTLDLK